MNAKMNARIANKKRKKPNVFIRLTEPQERVLRFMVDEHDRGTMPSVRDICRHFGWSSPNAAHQHICALADLRLVERCGVNSRLRLMPPSLALYSKRKLAKEIP